MSLIRFLILLCMTLQALASSYEAELPEGLTKDADMCRFVNCADVIPGADSFSPRMGNPSYVEAYRSVNGQRQLLGYVFLSTDVVDIPAYSGKPVVTLIGMDAGGRISGVRILKHSEPILLVGIPESKLLAFIHQYIGKKVTSRFEVGNAQTTDDYVGVDAISGATVTVIAENQVISRSAYEIAKQVGLIKTTPKPQANFVVNRPRLDWPGLLKNGSVKQMTIEAKALGAERSSTPYIDMYFAYLNVPATGQSLLGAEAYKRLMADLKPGEHALLIISNGTGSFKGSGFVRGGIYDRIQVKQDRDSFTFRDTDYLNLYELVAKGAPSYKESGIFILRNKSFSAAYPWSLTFLANKVDRETGAKSFANFEQEYWVPDEYLQGGRPKVERPDPTWLKIWKARRWDIAGFVVYLLAVVITFANRDRLVRASRRQDKRWVSVPKTLFWLIGIGFVGFHAMAQPSVTQILTWVHSLVYEWKWELFLSDPLIFIFWWFIIITILLWGRGLFCGWMCPFGSLSEIVFKIGSRIGLKRLQGKVPKVAHDKLKWIKYAIFLGLLAVSFYSMSLAERLAEVEPFKTTFLVGVWNRSWPFITYWSVLILSSLLIERPFCKYLCPLGAGLAIPSTLRWLGLKRKSECNTCHACQAGCGSQAIADDGRIDPRECLLCLDCMVMYYDDHACPPLAKERKERAKKNLPLTAIGKDGYYIPVRQIE